VRGGPDQNRAQVVFLIIICATDLNDIFIMFLLSWHCLEEFKGRLEFEVLLM
jgi:hypothetical protein